MKLLKSVQVVVLAGLLFATNPARASKTVTNFAYVQSMEMGVVYARCVPEETEGTKGTTKIYRVGKDRDELMDSYNWYSKNAVVLAWSPIEGKVAVMALGGAPTSKGDGQTELSFYLGGKFLNSYTSQDLKAWGADVWQRGGRSAIFKVLGQEQIPGTNDYVFSIEIKGKKFSFDILTGKPFIARLSSQVKPANRTQYKSVLDASRWANPYLVVQQEGVEVVSPTTTPNRKLIPVENLQKTLLELPISAWPYGKVVAWQENGARGDNPRLQKQNKADAERILKSLQVEIERWPGA